MINNQLLLLLIGVIIYFYFILLSVKFPIIPAAIYPFTFIISTQTLFSIGGISPSKYIGAVLIFVGMILFLNEIKSNRQKRNLLLKLFCLFIIFPAWILVRFLIEGSEMNLVFTFLLNALTIFSIVVIVDDKKRKNVMEISLGITFFIVSLGMIIAFYFPWITIFGTSQQSEYTRTIGLINDPNYGGTFIAIGIMYFLSKLVYSYETGRKKQFFLFFSLFGISVISLIFTISRAAILSVIVCSLFMILFGEVKLKNMAWFSLVSIFLYWLDRKFPMTIDAVTQRLLISTVDNSNIARLRVFREGFHVFQENMLWGVGKSMGFLFHNTFIDVAVFGGVIGLLFFVLLIVVVLMMNIKIMNSHDQEFSDMARFVIFGLFVFIFNSMLIALETDRLVWFLFGWGLINFILYGKAHPVAKTTPALDLHLQLNSKQ